jgi:hypothetical protein
MLLYRYVPQSQKSDIRFEVLIAMNMKVTFFWDVTPCSLVARDQSFEGTCASNYPEDGDSKFLRNTGTY